MQIDSAFLARHIDYSRWATTEILAACEPVGREELTRHMYTSLGSLLGTLVHIYQADSVWLGRLKGNPTTSGPEPPVNLAGLRVAWQPVLDGLHEFAASVTPDRVEAPIAFRSSERGDCVLPLWQVILHVVNHATYHRGQATTLLRQLGHTAVSTDLSYFALDH